jgi:hypothetical protein
MTHSGFVYQHPTAERPISGIDSGLWQTPVADDSVNRKRGKWNSRGEPKLSAQVKHPEYWLTPTVCGNYNAPKEGTKRGTGLATAARMWPMPCAGSVKWGGTMQEWGGSQNWVRKEMPELAAGQLNPEWVEWLMGWPIGWTDLKPLAMAKFQEWQRQHSPALPAINKEAA